MKEKGWLVWTGWRSAWKQEGQFGDFSKGPGDWNSQAWRAWMWSSCHVWQHTWIITFKTRLTFFWPINLQFYSQQNHLSSPHPCPAPTRLQSQDHSVLKIDLTLLMVWSHSGWFFSVHLPSTIEHVYRGWDLEKRFSISDWLMCFLLLLFIFLSSNPTDISEEMWNENESVGVLESWLRYLHRLDRWGWLKYVGQMRSDLWKNLTEQWNLWSHAGELGPPKKFFFSSKPHYNPKILYGEMSEGRRTSCCGSPPSQWVLQSVPTDVVILTHGELQ